MNKLAVEYEQDIYMWTLHNAQLLKQRRWDEVDVEHLIEELETMARRDQRELVSRFIVLLTHLLKWQFQPTQRSNSWEGSIVEQRIQIMRLLKSAPSLKNYCPEAIADAYPDAVKIAVRETKLVAEIFPNDCPYTITQLLDESFFPN
jgi:hypothetical protein